MTIPEQLFLTLTTEQAEALQQAAAELRLTPEAFTHQAIFQALARHDVTLADQFNAGQGPANGQGYSHIVLGEYEDYEPESTELD